MISYLITDPKSYGSTSLELLSNLKKALLVHCPDFICFRDKVSANSLDLAGEVIKLKNEYKGLFFLNGHPNDAKSLGFDGVHLRSSDISEAREAKTLGLKVIASTHSDAELKLAFSFGVEYMTYSPIYFTPHKEPPKGVCALKKVTQKYKNIIALGGVDSSEKIDEVKSAGAAGFASIRYFKQPSVSIK